MPRFLLAAVVISLLLPLHVSAQEKTITIINRREAFPIWNVYITPAGDSYWGQDQLGGRVIGTGESYTWTIPWEGCYIDVKAATFTGLSAEQRRINVCGGFEWTIYDASNQQSKSLTIVNRRETYPIWTVYITPAGDSGWGQDQLGGRVIGVGESYTWTIPWSGCYIDVKATTFTGLSTERRNLNVCGGMVWTVYDTNPKN